MQAVNTQQWETVILNKKNNDTHTPKPKPQINHIDAKLNAIDSSELPSDIQNKKINTTLRTSFQIARLSLKLTQKELAQKAAIDIRIVSEIESGKRIFNDTEIRKCEKILGKLQRKLITK